MKWPSPWPEPAASASPTPFSKKCFACRRQKMNDTLIALIGRLNDVIARETMLLETLDLRRAGALVGEKLSAQKALQAACMTAAQDRAASDAGEPDDALRQSIEQLERL